MTPKILNICINDAFKELFVPKRYRKKEISTTRTLSRILRWPKRSSSLISPRHLVLRFRNYYDPILFVRPRKMFTCSLKYMLYASILCVFLPKPFNSLTLSPRKDDITLTNDNASVLEIAEKLGATTFLEYVHKTNLTKNFTQPGTILFTVIMCFGYVNN